MYAQGLLATTDGLTGLYNHRSFHEFLRSALTRGGETQAPVSLLLIDIDRFKEYNDKFGHSEGDAVLRKVGSLIQGQVRRCDCVARYSGEVFAIILPECDAADAGTAAERVREEIGRESWEHRSITVSIGGATTSKPRSGAELLSRAESALHRSKQSGRNCATHITDGDSDVLPVNRSFPYSEIMREMLAIQNRMLFSAAEVVKERLIDAYDRTIQSWCNILDLKDKETQEHSARVTDLMTRLARSVSMNEEEVLYARWGALLHDIGKIGIPDSILSKPETLTEDEWIIMRRHPAIAFEMLSPISFLRPALDIPYCHHEKWDGSGYPQGLKGDEIPVAARLFAVIDVYDALRSDRPYRAGWPESRVYGYLREQSGSHFDPRAVDAFLKMLRAQGDPFGVELKRAA